MAKKFFSSVQRSIVIQISFVLGKGECSRRWYWYFTNDHRWTF